MKPAKFLAVAVLAAVAATALVAPGTASAAKKKVFCKTEEHPCKEGDTYKSGTKISGQSSGLTMTLEALPEVGPVALYCEESQIEGETTADKGEQQLPGKITALEFLGCELRNEKEETVSSCGVGAVQLPYEFLVTDIENTQDGVFTIYEQEEGGQPGFLVSCPSVGLKCVYKVRERDEQVKKDAGHFILEGGEEAVLNSGEGGILLKEVGLSCPGENPRWFSVYTIHEPKPLYVSYVEQ